MEFPKNKPEKEKSDFGKIEERFQALAGELRGITGEISGKNKVLRDAQSAEIDRIYSEQRNLDFKKEFVDPDPIAHVEKVIGSKIDHDSGNGISLPEIDASAKERILRLLRDYTIARDAAAEFLKIAKKHGDTEEIRSREEFLKAAQEGLDAAEEILRGYVKHRSAKFLDDVVKEVDSRGGGK